MTHDVEYYAHSTSQANQSKLAQFVDGITLGAKARPTNRSREDSNMAIVGYDCSIPTKAEHVQSVDLGAQQELCQCEQDGDLIGAQQEEFILLQKTKFREIQVRTCEARISTIPYGLWNVTRTSG